MTMKFQKFQNALLDLILVLIPQTTLIVANKYYYRCVRYYRYERY